METIQGNLFKCLEKDENLQSFSKSLYLDDRGDLHETIEAEIKNVPPTQYLECC